jgi:hypothetical protein
VFSNNVLGVLSRLIISTKDGKNKGTNCFISPPNCTAISPIAQIALLQTEIYSGCKFCAKIGMNKSKIKKIIKYYSNVSNLKTAYLYEVSRNHNTLWLNHPITRTNSVSLPPSDPTHCPKIRKEVFEF